MAKKQKGIKEIQIGLPGDFDLVPVSCYNPKSVSYQIKKVLKKLKRESKQDNIR